MKQLIEDLISAMEYHIEQTRPIHSTSVALQAAREALKAIPASVQEPVQEPVAYAVYWGHELKRLHSLHRKHEDAQKECSGIKSFPVGIRPLIFGDTTSPAAQREWVGLTNEQRDEICLGDEANAIAIEALLKRNNT